MEARRSWSSGEDRIRRFPPPPLVKSPRFSTVLLLVSFHHLKVGVYFSSSASS